MGVIVAFVYSVITTLAPQAFPSGMRDAHGIVGVYFEVASAIVALVPLREWLVCVHEGARALPFANCSRLRQQLLVA